MPNTPVWALPYPTYADAGDGPDGFLDLANRIEALLTAIDGRLDALEVPVVSASGVTASSGFSVQSERLVKMGGLVSVTVKMRRTGSNITAPPPSGNISNTPMFTVPSGYRPSSGNYGSVRVGPLGPMGNGSVDSAGIASVTAFIPGDTWSTGEDWTWVGTWTVV